jgi:hypothetical protein
MDKIQKKKIMSAANTLLPPFHLSDPFSSSFCVTGGHLSLRAVGLLLEFKVVMGEGGQASHHSCSFLSARSVSYTKATDRRLWG